MTSALRRRATGCAAQAGGTRTGRRVAASILAEAGFTLQATETSHADSGVAITFMVMATLWLDIVFASLLAPSLH